MLVCGIDEVGRGAFAGPILAACALFNFDQGIDMAHPPIPGLADSKAFSTERKREEVWYSILRSPYLIDFGVGECSVAEIDAHGIDACNNTAFQRAILCMKLVPEIIYVDGDKPIVGWPREKQIVEAKADGKYWPVSAASIIAKVIRDRLMNELDRLAPGYAWHENKGYGTALHRERLKLNGPTEHHRRQYVRKTVSFRT